LREGAAFPEFAGVAQLVEHLICNQRVGGSNPFASSSKCIFRQAADSVSGATGFSNALHSVLFRCAVIDDLTIRQSVIFAVFLREPWFPCVAKKVKLFCVWSAGFACAFERP
jgi:hypothetical protein